MSEAVASEKEKVEREPCRELPYCDSSRFMGRVSESEIIEWSRVDRKWEESAIVIDLVEGIRFSDIRK